MSDRNVNLVLLAGVSTIAAGYFLFFRKRETHKIIIEEPEILTPTGVVEIIEFEEYKEPVNEKENVTLEETPTVNEEILEDASGRRTGESLMEWIERQLKEAEEKGVKHRRETSVTTSELVEERKETVKERSISHERVQQSRTDSISSETNTFESMVVVETNRDVI